MMTNAAARAEEPVRVVYDGACPFCAAYVRLVRLRETVGLVELIDARSDHPVLERIGQAGLDLDEGMVVEIGGTLHHGAVAMAALAGMTTRAGPFNCLVRTIFLRPRLARLTYPLLVHGRAIALRLLGRRKIDEGAFH